MVFIVIGHPLAEFLKAVIMQSDDCAKYLRICPIFLLMNAEQEKSGIISCIFHKLIKKKLVSHVFMSFLTQVSAQNVQSSHFDCAQKFAFRKSAPWVQYCIQWIYD